MFRHYDFGFSLNSPTSVRKVEVPLAATDRVCTENDLDISSDLLPDHFEIHCHKRCGYWKLADSQTSDPKKIERDRLSRRVHTVVNYLKKLKLLRVRCYKLTINHAQLGTRVPECFH